MQGVPKKAKPRAKFIALRVYQITRRVGTAFIVKEHGKLAGLPVTQRDPPCTMCRDPMRVTICRACLDYFCPPHINRRSHWDWEMNALCADTYGDTA